MAGKTTTRRPLRRAATKVTAAASALAAIKTVIGDYPTAGVVGPDPPDRGAIPTGVLPIDVLTGVGGFPRGRLTILHGPEGSGKTTLALEAVAECQRRGGLGVYLDLEAKLDYRYAAAIGVDLSCLTVDVPKSIELGYELLEKVVDTIATKAPDLPVVIVWDSYHAGEAHASATKKWTEADFPREAKAYSVCSRRFKSVLARSGAVMIGISQVRSKIDSFGPGHKDIVAVGNAPLFYASVILRLRPNTRAAQTGKATGHPVVAFVQKSCVGDPFRLGTFHVRYGAGTDKEADLFEGLKMVGLAHRASTGLRIHPVGDCDPWKCDDIEVFRETVLADPELRETLTRAVYDGIEAARNTLPVADPGEIVADADELAAVLAREGGDDDK